MARNVLVLGSGPVAREVPRWVNKKRIATAAVVDKPKVPPGHSQQAFAENTAHISPFKNVQSIDVVILVAAKATVENDRRIYERLSEWNSKVIVIADCPLGFTPTEIVVSGSGTYSLEAVLQLFEEIKQPGQPDHPEPPRKYKKHAAALGALGVAMLLFFYTHPFPVTEDQETKSKKVQISFTYPGSLEIAEVGEFKVDATQVPKDSRANVTLSLSAPDMTCREIKEENGRDDGNDDSLAKKYAEFTCTVKSKKPQSNKMPITLTVNLGVDPEEVDEFEFLVTYRAMPFKRYTPSAAVVTFLLSLFSAPWKRWWT